MDSGPLVRSASTIREVSPATTSFEFGPSSTPIHAWLPPQESALREYLRVLIKRKWTVLGCLAAIFSIVAIASFKQTPIYEAMGRIAINKPDYTLTNFKDSSGGGSDYADPTDMDTEVTILQSDLLALQVIKSLNLDKMPELGGRPGMGPADALAPDTMQASDWLSKQLVDLQMKVETSQEKLVKFQKEHEILGTDEKQNIITEKLGELNKELTGAESARMEKESLYRLVQSGDPEVVAATADALEAGGTGGGNLAPLVASLRAKQADLKIQIAELSTQFGPSYPKVAQLNN